MSGWQIVKRLVHTGSVGDAEQEGVVILLRDGANEYWAACHATQPHPPSYGMLLEVSSLPLRIQHELFAETVPRTAVVVQPVDIGKPLKIYRELQEVPIGIVVEIEGAT